MDALLMVMAVASITAALFGVAAIVRDWVRR